MNKETVYSLITFADYLAIRYKEQYGEDISKKDEEYKRARNNDYGIMNSDKIIDDYCKTKF